MDGIIVMQLVGLCFYWIAFFIWGFSSGTKFKKNVYIYGLLLYSMGLTIWLISLLLGRIPDFTKPTLVEWIIIIGIIILFCVSSFGSGYLVGRLYYHRNIEDVVP